MTREELDTEIVVAITVFKAAKREELLRNLEEARADGKFNTHSAADAAWYALDTAWDALKAYDEENT